MVGKEVSLKRFWFPFCGALFGAIGVWEKAAKALEGKAMENEYHKVCVLRERFGS